MMKWLNRFRRRLANGIRPKPAWSNKTHTAYPEIITTDDGDWTLRFYAYEPYAWEFNGETTREQPAFPEPEYPHPTTFPHGQAPSKCVEAWKAYYEQCPRPLTLLEETGGKASGEFAAKTRARQAMLKALAKYRRSV